MPAACRASRLEWPSRAPPAGPGPEPWRYTVTRHQLHRAQHPVAGQPAEVAHLASGKPGPAGRLIAARDAQDLVGIADGDHVLLDQGLRRRCTVQVRARSARRRAAPPRAPPRRFPRRGVESRGALARPPRRLRVAIAAAGPGHLLECLRDAYRTARPGSRACPPGRRRRCGASRSTPGGAAAARAGRSGAPRRPGDTRPRRRNARPSTRSRISSASSKRARLSAASTPKPAYSWAR